MSAPSDNAPSLTPVSYAILGFITRTAHSGYDIKQLTDLSTSFFFAASYGQIYPELKKLESAGYATSKSTPQGKRERTEYLATPAGIEALQEWIGEQVVSFDLKDEGLLRMFFADNVDRDEQLALLNAIHADRLKTLRTLEGIKESIGDEMMPTTSMVLDWGIGFGQFYVDWCERHIAALEKSPKE